MVFFVFSLVLFVFWGFSLGFISFYYAHVWFIWLYNGYPRVSFGSRLVFRWFGPGRTAPGYSGSSLRPRQERVAGAAQRCPRCSGASKSFNMIIFKAFRKDFRKGGRVGFPPWPTLEKGGGSSPELLQTLQSSKKLQMSK